MTPHFIIIHHSAISRRFNDNQFDAINRYHVSLGWGKIGYHYLIEPSGLNKPGRAENEVGAHCKEQSMNFESLGVCLTGNFDIERPVNFQIYALRDLLRQLALKYNIKKDRLFFHRDFAHYKSCPGRFIDRGFIRGLINS